MSDSRVPFYANLLDFDSPLIVRTDFSRGSSNSSVPSQDGTLVGEEILEKIFDAQRDPALGPSPLAAPTPAPPR